MLDQTFSAKNFRRVYEIENRRGRNVDRAFFQDLVEASARITAASAAIRTAKRDNAHLSEDALSVILQPLRESLREERSAREALVDSTMDSLAQEILNGYQINLEQRVGPGGGPLYTLPADPRGYFVGKQLQYNISRLYKLRAGNRRAIISQIFDTLNTGFGQYIIRTDISSFYESIDRTSLIKSLENDQLLSFGSKKYIKQALSSYGSLSGSAKGIPRGLGISAFLSELFMRPVDEHIKQMKGITFYARYVDDIIIIFSPSATDNTVDYLGNVNTIVEDRGLTLHPDKTIAGSTSSAQPFNFDYLGYRFTIAGGRCKIALGQKKHQRYRDRVNRAFSAYSREAIYDQKGAARLLAARIKFMTGNTRLINNKRHAYTGIYFNNSHLTDLGRLSALDAYLKHRIAGLTSAALQNRLDDFSFLAGFLERRFYRYSTRDLAEIVKAWQYEA